MTDRTLQVSQHLLMATAIVLLATFALAFADRSVSSHLASKPSTTRKKEVETLREFAPRFLDGYARANRSPKTVNNVLTVLSVL